METIREFLASAAVTLILDLPFMGIFLAVMFWYSWQLSLITVGILALIVVLSLAIAQVFRTSNVISQVVAGDRVVVEADIPKRLIRRLKARDGDTVCAP